MVDKLLCMCHFGNLVHIFIQVTWLTLSALGIKERGLDSPHLLSAVLAAIQRVQGVQPSHSRLFFALGDVSISCLYV